MRGLIAHSPALSTPPDAYYVWDETHTNARKNLDGRLYPILVHRPAASIHAWPQRYAVPTICRRFAVARNESRCGQLTRGLSPPRVRPCWGHRKKTACFKQAVLYVLQIAALRLLGGSFFAIAYRADH